MYDVKFTRSQHPVSDARRRRLLEAPVFGESFTDHMVTMRCADGEWGAMSVEPFGSLSLSPATLALHYGQSIFEALKAYRLADGEVGLFRPGRNASRMSSSAERMAMPLLPDGAFESACELLVDIDRDWVPSADGSALYVRPFMFGSEPHLSVRPAREYLFSVIACPVASYFGDQVGAISVLVESEDVRAVRGGTGAAKFAGNYAAGFAAHRRATERDCDQVLWLDAAEHRWVEELNAMNVFFLWEREGIRVLTTPPLTGTILDGVTRDSLLDVAADLVGSDVGGIAEVKVEPTSVQHLRAGVEHGKLLEAFACGTAAVVVPIGKLSHSGQDLVIGDGLPGPTTMRLRCDLLDIQYGRSADRHGWVHRVPRHGLLTTG